MKKSQKTLVVILIIVAGILIYSDMAKVTYHGPKTIETPIQGDMEPTEIQHIDFEGNTVPITLKATYTINCGVKSIEKYVWDNASVVSHKDMVLVWGDLMQESIDEHITYSQANRWYYYRYDATTPVSQSYISKNSSNTHMIPADSEIEKRINKIKVNDYVTLDGYLVTVHFEYGEWSSSLSRSDTGDGACEIFYVTSVEIH